MQSNWYVPCGYNRSREIHLFWHSFELQRASVSCVAQLMAMETKQLEINTFVAKNFMSRLNDATRAVSSLVGRLHKNDIDISARIITRVLKYEARQTGLNLTHTQDRNFIQVVFYPQFMKIC